MAIIINNSDNYYYMGKIFTVFEPYREKLENKIPAKIEATQLQYTVIEVEDIVLSHM